jgi:two-component system LytT family response regulator
MKVLLIEDEELTARKLQRLLADVEPAARVVGLAGSIEASVAWLQANPAPDLILMDIELADGQSFEIFNRTAVASPVIFTTAYDEYAIKAFKVHSIDYLLKPVKAEDLRRALTKLQELKGILHQETDTLPPSLSRLLAQLAPPPAAAVYRDRFMIKQGQRLFSVPVEEVAYFFSRNKISFLKTHQGHEWMVEYTLDQLDKLLDPRRFFRLNRQVIAGLNAVDKVHLYFNNKLKIQLLPGFEEEVLVSREKAGEFKLWMGE